MKLDNASCEVLETVLSRVHTNSLDLEKTNLEDEVYTVYLGYVYETIAELYDIFLLCIMSILWTTVVLRTEVLIGKLICCFVGNTCPNRQDTWHGSISI